MILEEVNRSMTEPWLLSFIELLGERFGLHVPARRITGLRRAIVDAYVASGDKTLDAYLSRVSTAPLDAPCVAELVSRVTIKETYFFRDEGTISALRELVLPRLIARKRASRDISIWCAGCSNGEEPYTLAILLDEILGPDSDVRVRIVGTDLDEHALTHARAGEYGSWSVRALTPDQLKRYFDPRGTKLRVRDRYRRSVQFELNNLADPSAPTPSPGSFDLVLCRNVGIYFSEPAIAALYASLSRSLRPGGIIITAPSDPRPPASSGVEAVLLRGAVHAIVAYVREATVWESPAITVGESEPAFPVDSPSTIPAPMSRRRPPPEPLCISILPDLPETVDTPILPSSQGAGSCTEHAGYRSGLEAEIARAPLHAAPYFELALLEIERGAYEAAESSLRRVLYLAPELPEAHYHLGMLLVRSGDTVAARRSFLNALRAATAVGGVAPSWAASIGMQLARLEREKLS